MDRPSTPVALAVISLVAASLLGAAVAPAAAVSPAPSGVDGSSPADTAQRAANETDRPGARVAGIVAARGAAIDGRVEIARFEQRYDAAGSDAERAAVVADALDRARERLERLREQSGELDGTADARLAAEAGAIRELATALYNASAALPGDRRAAADIELASIARLRDDAATLASATRPASLAIDRPVLADLERMIGAYNEAAEDRQAGLVGGQLRGERVTFRVRDGDDSAVISFRISTDDRIEEVGAGPRGDASILVTTDRETVRAVESPRDLVAAYRRDDVDVTGVGPVNRLEWTAVDVVSDLLDR